MATSVIPKSQASDVNALTNRLSKVQFKTFVNTTKITIDLGYTPSAGAYGHVILANVNQNVLCGISVGMATSVYKWSSTSLTITASVSGSTLTIEISGGTLWGVTTVLIDKN